MGVWIPGFGTFTFMKEDTDVENNKFLPIQRPMFILAKKLVWLHGLKQNKMDTPGDIPVVLINSASIALGTSLSRNTVEHCIKKTLHVFFIIHFLQRKCGVYF
ncbi:coiled-coil domain-containing protein 81-like [Suricata suricatta]|uniref:coiled-coil domain-containing protein 81-like n=1 Tax=Suricata suricatta TaxID=37032 RepID=UPI00115627CA|nr:coiled-coil domain-containing protein 81-like [Suricata suricatta]